MYVCVRAHHIHIHTSGRARTHTMRVYVRLVYERMEVGAWCVVWGLGGWWWVSCGCGCGQANVELLLLLLMLLRSHSHKYTRPTYTHANTRGAHCSQGSPYAHVKYIKGYIACGGIPLPPPHLPACTSYMRRAYMFWRAHVEHVWVYMWELSLLLVAAAAG